jgi:hypothetical protein
MRTRIASWIFGTMVALALAAGSLGVSPTVSQAADPTSTPTPTQSTNGSGSGGNGGH